METTVGPKKNGIGKAGMIVSIVGFVLSFIPIINILGFVVALVGGVLSLIGVFKQPRKLAIIGLILSALGPLMYLMVISALF